MPSGQSKQQQAAGNGRSLGFSEREAVTLSLSVEDVEEIGGVVRGY